MIGSQTPRIDYHPVGTIDDADDAAFLASQYGLTPDEWQRNVLNSWMRRKRDGRWAAGRWGLAVARQNGKNGILEVVELYFMAVLGLKILHTAHEVKTARKAFVRIASFFENERKYPELAEMVKEIRRTNGQEAIVLHALECGGGEQCDCKGGGSVEFIARSKGSGRGFTVDVLVCDEAQEYGEDAQAALLPTISSAPSGDPLQILLGTPPAPSMDGTVFTRMRTAGIEGKAKRLAWCEWSIEGKADKWDRAKWAETNPSLGIRLNASTIEDEAGAMSDEMFARERYGRWDPNAGNELAIPYAIWQARIIDPTDAGEGTRSYAVKFSLDGATIGLAGARKPEDGPVHVVGIREASVSEGTEWLVDWLVERHADAAQIVIDGKSGVGYLVNALRDSGVRNKRLIIVPTTEQVTSAHSMMDHAIRQGGMTTQSQPDVESVIQVATKRAIGVNGGFGWAAPEGHSTVLLDAMTYAFWAARTSIRKPGRKAVFV